MAKEAAASGIEMFALTDHGPAIHGTHEFYFANLKTIPTSMYGVRVLKGIEANIMDFSGSLDLDANYLKNLDYVIASFHDVVILPGNEEEHTNALINVLKNPLVDTLGHPGNPAFPVDIDTVVKTARDYGKLIEVNNHSFEARAGCLQNCREFILKCIKYGVKIVCSSDAHISFDVGRFDKINKLLEECNVPDELIMSKSVERFEEYLKIKAQRLKAANIA
jgi:putative hydrolase